MENLKKAGRVLYWVVFGVGLFYAVKDFSSWAGWTGGAAAPVAVEAQAQSEAAQPGACLCDGGAWCEGPQGGRYCLRANGTKKYAPK